MSIREKAYNYCHRLCPDILIRKTCDYICKSYPINFGVEVTNICNTSCSFCGYRFQERAKGIMRNYVFKRAVDEYCSIGGGDINLTPTVGEPLLDKNIIEKIRYAREKKNIAGIWFYTNIIPLSQFNIEEILVSGLSSLRISTCIKDRNTFKEIYGANYYDMVLENIIKLCERNAQLNHPVKVKLFLRVPKPFEQVIGSDDYKSISRYFNQDDIIFLDDLYDSWGGRITESDLPFGNKIYKIPYDITKEPCYELFRRINILYDGTVNFCICRDLNADLKIGNIMEKNIIDIWRGEEMANLRDSWYVGNVPDICLGCQRYLPLSVFYTNQHKNIINRYLKNTL